MIDSKEIVSELKLTTLEYKRFHTDTTQNATVLIIIYSKKSTNQSIKRQLQLLLKVSNSTTIFPLLFPLVFPFLPSTSCYLDETNEALSNIQPLQQISPVMIQMKQRNKQADKSLTINKQTMTMRNKITFTNRQQSSLISKHKQTNKQIFTGIILSYY